MLRLLTIIGAYIFITQASLGVVLVKRLTGSKVVVNFRTAEYYSIMLDAGPNVLDLSLCISLTHNLFKSFTHICLVDFYC